MSNPAVPSLNTSNLSIKTTSRHARRNKKLANACLTLLACVGLLGLATTTYLTISEMKRNKTEVELEQQKALAVEDLIATKVISDSLEINDNENDNMTLLSLNSKPSGASVYLNGFYIGDTPINEKKFKKSNENIELVMVKEDHEVARRLIKLVDEIYSDTLTLAPKIIEQTPSHHKAVAKEGVVANKAVVITQPAPAQKKKTTAAKKNSAAAQAPAQDDIGIVLPD